MTPRERKKRGPGSEIDLYAVEVSKNACFGRRRGNEQMWGIDRDLKPSNSYQIPFEPIIRYKNDMYSLGLPIFCFA